MKLYLVTVEYEVCVLAESRDAAEREAECADSDEKGEPCATATEITAKNAALVPFEWRGSIPINSDDDRTVAEILGGEAEHVNGGTDV